VVTLSLLFILRDFVVRLFYHDSYLEAYNEASALASNEEQNKGKSSEAELLDKYNIEKRSKPLLQKHQEEVTGRLKKKSKQFLAVSQLFALCKKLGKMQEAGKKMY
jgi:hypothetical protein